MSDQKSVPVIQSLQTGIQIIEMIVNEGRPLKFSEIQELTGMTKSNLHKYLNTLTITGILFRNKQQGAYYLGSKLIEFGNAAIGSVDLIEVATPYLKAISRKTQLTTLLSVWTHDGPVIANIWSTNIGLNIGAQIGTRLPILSSAGKLFLSFKQTPDVEDWRQKKMQNLNEQEKNQVKEELPSIQQHYFSYAEEPLVQHVSSFSVPILNYDQDMIGCITVVGFTQHIPNNDDHKISKYVRKEAFLLSESFGWQKEK